MLVSRPLEPVLGRKGNVESEFEVRISYFGPPVWKHQEKRKLVFDHLWRHESYQAPLSSDGISDLNILQENDENMEILFFVVSLKRCLYSPHVAILSF